ncbi:MAG TPA: hypothetical protein VG322_17185 [Candidatus Acidoferrales bacterium]|jgi:hypothetical protein|nr:hypothetical protein [Candidatus Acidoferrales bacterium]
MSTTSAVNDLVRPLRRSTRLNTAVSITVMGVDSYRGPYREDVSTVTVNAHGCKYESKHDVLTNSWVMLELPRKEKGESVSARGLVKWVKRPMDTSGVFETAIELENPGNIWGIDAPPQDWLTLCESQVPSSSGNGKSKPFAVPKADAPKAPVAAAKSGNGSGVSSAVATRPAVQATQQPAGLVMGDFHQQMERMLFDAAATAVREQANATMEDVRHNLRDEAKIALAEIASTQTAPWIEQTLKQLNKSSQESAKMLHAVWTKRLESDIARALERVEERSRELDTLAQSLSANALDRLQRGLESSRGEGVDRIISKLKEQSAPVIDHAKETIAELSRHREQVESSIEKQHEQIETSLEQSVARSSAKIEKICNGFEKQFEMIIRERVDVAREELQSALKSSVDSATANLASAAQQHQAESQAVVKQAFESLESALADIKAKAAESSREFASQLSEHSRTHLESLGNAIAEAARGVGKNSAH